MKTHFLRLVLVSLNACEIYYFFLSYLMMEYYSSVQDANVS